MMWSMRKYRGRTWWETNSWWVWTITIAALLIGVMVAAVMGDGRQKDACLRDGGQVIDVHGSQDNGWMCLPAQKAERP